MAIMALAAQTAASGDKIFQRVIGAISAAQITCAPAWSNASQFFIESTMRWHLLHVRAAKTGRTVLMLTCEVMLRPHCVFSETTTRQVIRLKY
jgi:hypothetical protein